MDTEESGHFTKMDFVTSCLMPLYGIPLFSKLIWMREWRSLCLSVFHQEKNRLILTKGGVKGKKPVAALRHSVSM